MQIQRRLAHDALRRQLAGEPALTGPSPDSDVMTEDADRPPDPHADPQPDPQPDPQTGTDEAQVVDWLTRLHLLQGVPFNYLVPDIGMLRTESIRFFQVDNNWVEALLDGAYSIGFEGSAQGASAQARPHFAGQAAQRARSGASRRALLTQVRSRTSVAVAPPPSGADAAETLSGFLLRSAVVAGWPGVQATAFADSAGTQPLQLVRMEIVAPSLLLCLFAGVVARVDLHEPSQAVHFGVDGTRPTLQKDLRYANGDAAHPVGSYTGANVPAALRVAGGPAVLRLDTLARSMQNDVWTTPPPADTTFTAAQFGLEMVEGVEAVSFQRQPGS